MIVPDIESSPSHQTWGTCEETVLANNRGRPNLMPKSALSNDSSRILALDEIGTGSTTETAKSNDSNVSFSYDMHVARAAMKNAAVSQSAKTNKAAKKKKKRKEKSADGLSSLFDFIFCLGTDEACADAACIDGDEKRNPPGNGRGKRNGSSGRLGSRSQGSPGRASSRSMGSPSKSIDSSFSVDPTNKRSSKSLGSPSKSRDSTFSMSSRRSPERSSSKSMDSAAKGSPDSYGSPRRRRSNLLSRNKRPPATNEKNIPSGSGQTTLARNRKPPNITKRNTSAGSTTEDAELLEKTMQDFNKQQKQKKGIPPLGAAGLDIVMELQQHEFNNVPRSPDKRKKGSRHVGIVKDQEIRESKCTSPSLTPRGTVNAQGKWVNGSPLGSFKNISNEETALHAELISTYLTFRGHKSVIENVLKHISCSIPLYHSSKLMQRQESEISTASYAEISTKVKNVCSEPVSKLFNVRGLSYLSDGKKTTSEETMFTLLGADSILKKRETIYIESDVCAAKNSYWNKLRAACKESGTKCPFLIVINFVVPWGNLLAYFCRPDSQHGGPYNKSRKNIGAEKLWESFLRGNTKFRNNTLKFIPQVIEGPWALKKMVGTQPAMIGQKIPTSYFGSATDGYLEICMNVTKGGKVANSICNAVASKASIVSMDLAFLLQGSDEDELPEQLLSVMRLHHVRLKKVVSE